MGRQVAMQSININSNKAKGIAEIFIEQHYSILEIKEPALEDGVWVVQALVSAFGEQPRTIRIDAKTGRIISWSK